MTEPLPAARRSLVVVVPGLRCDLEPWKDLRRALEERDLLPERPDWLFLDHGVRRHTRKPLIVAAREIAGRIADQWRLAGGYDAITLVGHSAGALLLRRAWLNEIDETLRINPPPAPWAEKVDRFVLFAGISRGVCTESLSWPVRLLTRLMEVVPGKFTMEETFRGAGFITDLRIDWVRYFASAATDRPRPRTVQLLGSSDALVGREDSIDLTSFPNSELWDVPGGTHSNLHRFAQSDNPEARLRQIADALQFDRPQDPPPATEEPKSVLMIVHGIRASRIDDWVETAQRRVEERWPGQVVVQRPTYGYLSAVRFALPMVRKRYARYFRDFYTETISRHKGAPISVLCHSNGTYALGRCLLEFEAIRVERVALAGSVLPSDFKWSELVSRKRVKDLRSDGGSADWPVGILCRLLRSLGMKDVGTGGFDGFRDIANDVRYHPGGHGAMLAQPNLDSILGFLVEGQLPAAKALPRTSRMLPISRAVPYLAWLLLAALAAAVALALVQGQFLLVGGIVLALLLVAIVLDII